MNKKLLIFPKISPQIVQDKKGKASSIILKHEEYELIIDKINNLKAAIVELKKKQKNNK